MPIALRRTFGGFVILGAAVVASGGCSGGGSSPTAPAGSIAFAPDRAGGVNSIGLRRGAGTTSTRLELELVANQVTGVHDLDLVLGLPADLLRFTGQRQGSFLTQDGQPAFLFASTFPAPFGGVVVTDGRAELAPGVSGSGVICVLVFEAVSAGSGRIELNSPEALDASDRPIAGIDWIDGTATVVR